MNPVGTQQPGSTMPARPNGLDRIRRDLIANPETSNRALAAKHGIRDKAIAAIRTELEKAKQIPAVTHIVGKDGRRRKLRRRGAVGTTKAQLQSTPSSRPSVPSNPEKPLFQWYTAQRRSPAKATAPHSVLGQVRTAFSGHPLAFLVGMVFGGFVPTATWTLMHLEPHSWPSIAMIAAGCAFSALTVIEWAQRAWNWPKAVAFAVLVEGAMLIAQTQWLSGTALGLLIVINAAAAACALVRDDQAATGKNGS